MSASRRCGNWKFAAQQSAARTFSFVQHVGGAAAARTFPVSHSTVTFGVEVAGRRNGRGSGDAQSNPCLLCERCGEVRRIHVGEWCSSCSLGIRIVGVSMRPRPCFGWCLTTMLVPFISWLGAVVWNRGGTPNGSGHVCRRRRPCDGSAFLNRGLQATPRPLSPPVCLIDRNCAILIV